MPFSLLKPVFLRFNFRGPQEYRDNRGRSFNKVYKKKKNRLNFAPGLTFRNDV